MSPSDLFRWKTYFYDALLPALRAMGPERADAALCGLARASAAARPWQKRRLAAALAAAARAAGPSLRPATPGDLAAGALRFLARDYLLDTGGDDAAALARFDVTGGDAVDAALAGGRGLILVGAHLGAHLSALHWLYRRGVALKVVVQRPRHVSAALERYFDRDAGGPDPQEGYFLRRGLGPADCVARLLRVRAAVRSGRAAYFAGDIPWAGPNTRAGRLLGQTHRFLAVWADLSALTAAPVVFVFCNHADGGRFALRFEPAGPVPRGGEDAAVSAFLARLEAGIAARPDDAPAHLLWPCYGPPAPAGDARPARPGRRARGVAWEGL